MMRPHGRASRKKERSLGDKVSPSNPVINARAAIGAD
jgi:hypothetical protein